MPRTRALSDDIVLERAIGVFWQNGYAGTSLRDLTQATGLSSAALYHRFSDKNGLFVEVLRRYAEGGLGERLGRLTAAADPLGAIQSFLDELIALSLSDPHHRGCLLVNTALDGAAMSDEARALVRARLGEVERFFAGRLQQAVTNGVLAPQTDVAAQATALLGTVLAIRVMARLDPDPKRLRSLADQAIAALGAHKPGQSATHPTGGRA
ncbi:HTH-type transcriptional repressor ComR [mine drainage metagenome]|uniref:HTH-type transcriptional repressor ComR n=1 Tax=mine drainage metagenome TaxID=410659 RepID=A0A1J5SJE2_9ZZZZ